MPIVIPAADTPPVTPKPVWIRAQLTQPFWSYDISDFIATIDITYGRTSAYESAVSAATCSMTLDDTAGIFDPDNTASPLYGKLTVGPSSATTLRVGQGDPAGVWHPLYTGFLDSLERSFTGGDYSETTATFVDQTPELTRHVLPAGTVLPAELPGARINRLLNSTSRSGFRWLSRSLGPPLTLDTGQKLLGPYTCDGNTSSWDIAQGAAASEGGLLFFTPGGDLRFYGQARRLMAYPKWRLSDVPNTFIPYETDLTFRLSTDDVVVDAAVTTQDGVTSTYGPGGGARVTNPTGPSADLTETSQIQGWVTGGSRAAYLYQTRSKARRNAPKVTVFWGTEVEQWTY